MKLWDHLYAAMITLFGGLRTPDISTPLTAMGINEQAGNSSFKDYFSHLTLNSERAGCSQGHHCSPRESAREMLNEYLMND